jgi:fatty acid-binding protein DegV
MTDSIGQVPQGITGKCDIKLLPLGITIEGKTYPENEVNLAEWKEAGNLSTSSAISWELLWTHIAN